MYVLFKGCIRNFFSQVLFILQLHIILSLNEFYILMSYCFCYNINTVVVHFRNSLHVSTIMSQQSALSSSWDCCILLARHSWNVYKIFFFKVRHFVFRHLLDQEVHANWHSPCCWTRQLPLQKTPMDCGFSRSLQQEVYSRKSTTITATGTVSFLKKLVAICSGFEKD